MSLARQPPNQNPTDCSDLRGNIPARLLRKIVAKHVKTSIVSRAEAQPELPWLGRIFIAIKDGMHNSPADRRQRHGRHAARYGIYQTEVELQAQGRPPAGAVV